MKKPINIGQIRNKIMSIAPILLLLFPYLIFRQDATSSIPIRNTRNKMEVICTMLQPIKGVALVEYQAKSMPPTIPYHRIHHAKPMCYL